MLAVVLPVGTAGVAAVVLARPAGASTVRDAIVATARGELGNGDRNQEVPLGSNCNFYSGYWVSGSSGCAAVGFRNNYWCADFSRYVWKMAGDADREGLDSWAYSFWRYGLKKGTWHSRDSGYAPQPGDAVVFDYDAPFDSSNPQDIDHVGLVESFSGGTLTTIEGNSGDRIKRNTYSGALSRTSILGFASPVGAETVTPTPSSSSEAPAPASLSGQAIVHDGYTSVFTVNAADGHLEETFLTATGKPWQSHDLSAEYGTPPVVGQPVAVAHDGFTSVFTINASDGHVSETFLASVGQPWQTQDLTVGYGTPPAKGRSAAALFHDGYTSVYTINASDGHVSETYLTKIGQPWQRNDLTAGYGTPAAVGAPAALFHDGYTSVYTINASDGHVSETYLTKVTQPWQRNDLTAGYGTPPARP